MDSEYEGFDGFTEDSSMNGLFGNYAFIYIFKNFEMSRLSTGASGKKSNNLLGKNLQKEAKKNKGVLQRCKKKTFCLNFFYFCRYRLNQVLRSSEQLLSNKLVSLFAKSLESQVEVVEFDLEALLRVYTFMNLRILIKERSI